jgi:gas vesicle protein
MKEEMVMNKDQTISFSIGLLAGALMGGVVALLLAPMSGKETRKIIGDKSVEVEKLVEVETGRVMDTVKEAASEASRKGQAVARAITS